MPDNIERATPYSQQAEAAVICAMMMDKEAIALSIERITDPCFYVDRYRVLFKAMIKLFNDSVEVDPVTLSEQLKKDGKLEEIGGLQIIYEVAGSVPTAANAAFHINIVLEKYIQRSLISSCQKIITDVYEQKHEDARDMLNDAEAQIMKIQEWKTSTGMISLATLIHLAMADLDERAAKKEMPGVKTGYYDIDKKLCGMQPGDLIVIAGRPSHGKTALALNIALHATTIQVGFQKIVPTAIFSLEMTQNQLTQRMLCIEGNVNLSRWRDTSALTDLDWLNINSAANRLFSAPIIIDDAASITPLEIRAKCHRLKRREDIGLIIVDYLQLVQATGKEKNREQEVGYVSRSLKAIAMEMNIPVIAISQMSRDIEKRSKESKKPKLSDLRESGAIEQDADVVMFINRPVIAEEKLDNVPEDAAEIYIVKNRNGAVGKCTLQFISQFTKFENQSREGQEPPEGKDK